MSEINRLAIVAANGGDFAALLHACRSLITCHVQRVGFRNCIIGTEDLEQISAIAIQEALKTWDADRSSFSSFASRVIRCRILNAIHPHSSPTNKPEGNAEINEVEDGTVIISTMEMQDEAAAMLNTLTNRDRSIVQSIAMGTSYVEVGAIFGLTAGQVDNIVQRVRRKSRRIRAASL